MRFLVSLGEPLRLSKGRLRLGEPMTVEAYVYGLFGVGFVARFMIVCGLLQGHCTTKSDMFGCQYVCSNELTCDEFICANGHYMA